MGEESEKYKVAINSCLLYFSREKSEIMDFEWWSLEHSKQSKAWMEPVLRYENALGNEMGVGIFIIFRILNSTEVCSSLTEKQRKSLIRRLRKHLSPHYYSTNIFPQTRSRSSILLCHWWIDRAHDGDCYWKNQASITEYHNQPECSGIYVHFFCLKIINF